MDLEKYLKPNKSVTGDVVLFLITMIVGIVDIVTAIVNGIMHHPLQAIFFFAAAIVLFIFSVISARRAQLMTDYQQFRRRVLKMGTNEISVKEMASSWQKSDDYVRTAVSRFIEKGLLPQGDLKDDGDTIVIAKPLENESSKKGGKGKSTPNFDEIMAGFGKDTENLSIYLESISHEEIRNNLAEVVTSSKKIKDYLLDHKEKLTKARKFITIYTPAAVKLSESVKKAEDTGADEAFFTKATETSKNLALVADDVFTKLQDNDLLDETIEMSTLDQMISEDLK